MKIIKKTRTLLGVVPAVIITTSILLQGCEKSSSVSPNSNQSTQVEVQELKPRVLISSYKIISDESMGEQKRSVVIRLDEKLTEKKIGAIAVQVKSSDSQKYNRTFIEYYLPEMKVGDGAWATSHYNPDLKVKILGLSLEAEAEQKKQEVDPSKDVIGVWFDERPYVGAKLILYRKNGSLYINTKYKDGSESTKKLKQSKVGSALKLEDIDGSSFGEYWLLTGKELKVFDNEGHITTYRAG